MQQNSKPGKPRYCAIQRGLCFSCVLYQGDSLEEAECALNSICGRRTVGQLIDNQKPTQPAPDRADR